MNSQEYQDRLRAFYDRERIAVGPAFQCTHREDCCQDASPRPLTFGAEAHVGSSYGKSPCVVVVSLDARGDSQNIVERQSCIQGLQIGLNAHMRGTRQTIEALLGPELDGTSPWISFAMTNAAKCSGADGKGDKVPDALYQRCLAFAVEELRALDPDVVVTQGTRAHDVVAPITPLPSADLNAAIERLGVPDPSPVRNWVKAAAENYVGFSRITADADVITLNTPHPSDRTGRWQVFARLALPISSWLVRQLLSIRQQQRTKV